MSMCGNYFVIMDCGVVVGFGCILDGFFIFGFSFIKSWIFSVGVCFKRMFIVDGYYCNGEIRRIFIYLFVMVR